jgi:hypothetical protein
MSEEGQQRPLWLSVPAASGAACLDALDPGHWRLLQMIADHGLALSSWSAGQVDGQEGDQGGGPRGDQVGGGRCLETGPVRFQAMQACFTASSTPANTLSAPRVAATVLDLGRFDIERHAAGAQVFDLARGSANTRLGPAMSYHQLDRALSVGRQAVERAKLDRVRSIALQGAGAGAAMTNMLWASVLRQNGTAGTAAWLNGADADSAHGGGDSSALQAILARHARVLHDPYPALRHLGGLEHAALAGAALAAAQLGLPVLGIGPSASIGVRLAVRLNASIARWARITADAAVVGAAEPQARPRGRSDATVAASVLGRPGA